MTCEHKRMGGGKCYDCDFCRHEVIYYSLCAICGRLVEPNEASDSTDHININHKNTGIKVSLQEAERLEKEDERRLLKEKKLSLIVDLDQTILHAAWEPHIAKWVDENQGDKRAGEMSTFSLDGSLTKYTIKLRPGLNAFLQEIAKIYEMHIYTMGTRAYADAVAQVIDPTGSLFRDRILSRDENGSFTKKRLERLFPSDQSKVIILDDRADVWDFSPNLIQMKPYEYFAGVGDINAPPNVPKNPIPLIESSSAKDGESLSTSGSSVDSSLASGSSVAADVSDVSGSSPGADVTPEIIVNVANESKVDSARAAHVLSVTDSSSAAVATPEIIVNVADESKVGSAHVADVSAVTGSSSGADVIPEIIVNVADESKVDSSRAAQAPVVTGSSPSADAAPEIIVNVANESKVASVRAAGSNVESKIIKTDAHPTYTPKSQDPDHILPIIKDVLIQVHSEFYKQVEEDPKVKPDVATILSSMKSQVLDSCCVVFSGVIPLQTPPEKSSIWRMATSFGARCLSELTGKVTHLVAATIGTSKVNTARKYESIKIVSPSWLTDSAWEWQKQNEMDYIMTPPSEGSAASEVENPEEASLDFEDDHLDIDWDDSSVDAAVGDDDDDDTEEYDDDKSGGHTADGEAGSVVDLDPGVEDAGVQDDVKSEVCSDLDGVAGPEYHEEDDSNAEAELEVFSDSEDGAASLEYNEEADEEDDDDDWLVGQLEEMDEDEVRNKRKRDSDDEEEEDDDESQRIHKKR